MPELREEEGSERVYKCETAASLLLWLVEGTVIDKHSHREGDVAVVLCDIAFENVGAGTHDALEPLPIQLHAAHCALCYHCCSSWTIQK